MLVGDLPSCRQLSTTWFDKEAITQWNEDRVPSLIILWHFGALNPRTETSTESHPSAPNLAHTSCTIAGAHNFVAPL